MVATLAACQSSEERAEAYYQSALELLEEGDVERALIELRNVFDNNTLHREARRLYADLVLESGNVREAYGQYLRLVEQYPDAIDVRRLLAEIALDLNNFSEVTRHGTALYEAAPDVPEHQALMIFINYRDARQRQNNVDAGQEVEKAEALLDEHPKLSTALRILVDWHATSPSPMRAIPYLDRLLELYPDSQPLHMARLAVLQRAGETEEIGKQLHWLYERFPEDSVIADQLVLWYRAKRDFDTLETFLRDRAGDFDGPIAGHIAVVELLAQTRGRDAALAELNSLAEANGDTDLSRRYALQAALLEFNAGEREQAIATMSRIVEEAEQVDLINEARISLSRMKAATGYADEARALVEEVLESDPGNVPGLVARAAWNIREDKLSEAITGLRQALDQDPRNSETLILLAEAHQKMGNIELAEQRLAQAVEVTNAAPREALIYGRYQIAREQLAAAEQVLTDSFRTFGDLEVARLLGQVLLQRGDFEGARGILDRLANSENPNAAPLARALQAAIMFNQNRVEEGLAFLRQTADVEGENGEFVSALQILRVQMMSGRLEDARNQLAVMRSQFPENLALRLLEGNLAGLEGKPEEAIQIYQTLHDEHPDQPIVLQRLYSSLRENGRGDEAKAILQAGLERQPDAHPLLMLRAYELELEQQEEGAIEVYERLYKEDPDSLIVANNLASMLAMHRDNPEDVKRAYTIAQRLNGTKIPAMLDTLGWVQTLNGEYDAAILNLQAAVRGLPNNPTVAFNLAQAYAKAGRIEEARAELQRGFDLADGDEGVPQFQRALDLRDELGG
ncbi:tetratricopeptide repeat protein [Phycobacter sp. K97]|uniref:tetratricopeptide repeat protein n=1 Tax=Phycobacter sedimenti TaxID=3133977 RepID=UPI0031203BAE